VSRGIPYLESEWDLYQSVSERIEVREGRGGGIGREGRHTKLVDGFREEVKTAKLITEQVVTQSPAIIVSILQNENNTVSPRSNTAKKKKKGTHSKSQVITSTGYSQLLELGNVVSCSRFERIALFRVSQNGVDFSHSSDSYNSFDSQVRLVGQGTSKIVCGQLVFRNKCVLSEISSPLFE